jgi:nucleotide-binding universal stress UspA family protein
MRIVIAHDGSSFADEAVDGLRLAGLPESGDATVVSVVEHAFPHPHRPADDGKGHASELAERRAAALTYAGSIAERAAERVRKVLPGWQVDARAAFGSPSHEVIACAEEIAANLIVVGSHGRGVVGRILLGSISQSIATHAHVSVRVGRAGPAKHGSALRLLVGVEGSSGGSDAVREIARRVWPESTEARLVFAYEPLSPSIAGYMVPLVSFAAREANSDEREYGRQVLDGAVRELAATKLRVSRAILVGHPKQALLMEAEAWEANTVFMGSRGLTSGLDRFLLGSVSSAVAARAKCSVEIVRDGS